ncbi:MAG: PEP-utilizing enzyme [Chloroflexi bacterium]|nr:PEP-utilizing enzyme [Chloroflexota bacterium]
MLAMDATRETILWTAGFFNERFSEPVSPLGWSLIGPLVEELALREPLEYLGYPKTKEIRITRLWHGHPYTNVAVFQILYKIFPDWLLPEDAYRYFPDGQVQLRKEAAYPSSALSPRLLFSLTRAFFSDPGDVSPFHNYRKWAGYTVVHDRRVREMGTRVQGLEQSGAAARDILEGLKEVESIHRDLLRIHRWSLTHADILFGLLKRLARNWVDREHADEIAAEWIANVSDKTMQVDAALNRMADRLALAPEMQDAIQKADSYPELVHLLEGKGGGPEFLGLLQQFLAEHGHRSFSLDIAVPTFADDPTQVLHLLQGMSAAGRNGMARNSRTALAAHPLPPVRRGLLAIVRSLALKYVALREDQRYYWQKSLAISRRLYLVLAERLLAEGAITRREDVFYATHRELEEYCGSRMSRETLGRQITIRRSEWESYWSEFKRSPDLSYPAFLRGDEPIVVAPVQQQVWYARAVSPGTARGVVRICRSANDLMHVRPGEILVAPSTDPAWTPVFARIAGLVLERGGVLSHGAVVAREYGVPAVVGATSIADQVRDGETIEVDGNLGRIARIA